MKINNLHTTFLRIAGFRIKIQAKHLKNILIEDSMLPFTEVGKNQTFDLLISSYDGIPEKVHSNGSLIFESKINAQLLFSVYDAGNSFLFKIFNQSIKNDVFQIAILDKDLTEWTVYSQPGLSDHGIYPLRYPLGSLVCYYLTAKYETILLHASGIYSSGKGKIFTGFSGSGKSTIAAIYQKSGGTCINDDRIMVCKNENGFLMHNTPMLYVDEPRSEMVSSVYLLSHAKSNNLHKLSGAEAVSKLMAVSLHHAFEKKIIVHHLEFLSELCNSVNVYELGFVPDADVVDFVNLNEG